MEALFQQEQLLVLRLINYLRFIPEYLAFDARYSGMKPRLEYERNHIMNDISVGLLPGLTTTSRQIKRSLGLLALHCMASFDGTYHSTGGV